ncbi:MAG TPA: alanine/ornithine racemase family PLP-dependent enzyme [Myxococcota bacterium]|nr:alanine/ornithine racemase family PLP-dependent enzyme [Myxococcota bacterium]HON24364.1 alanine/ornithine racemase family PLP-dependent enzyme [Myxococcota bacterium]HOS61547.1 alanine/ornithine racemase family PLP-dependent enzyme [Myxococcota bacterium]HPC91583.1 alanine/ornithine racemase family PLP-dependent enzyme [Myxococcota bacterium]HPL24714.1 alanine/ornithine racemase family PLP-dependent enzyme [Myxococcota bacterium]
MPVNTPRLEIYTERIAMNAKAVIGMCHSHGIQVAAATKVVCGHSAVTHALEAGGADMLADSRVRNLRRIVEAGISRPLMMLRIPAPSWVADVVNYAEISLNSSVDTIEMLSDAAELRGLRHQVIVMVDVGDLREGVPPERAIDVVKETAHLPGVEIVGFGANLACFGGVIPTRKNMQTLVDVRNECRRVCGLELPILSGGNSANLPLVVQGEMPKEINHLRVGEAIVLGRNVIDRSPWEGTRQDTFSMVAEVLEVERKASYPIGDRGQDAFGGTPDFIDYGMRLRAICNIGRQDVIVDGIQPEMPGIKVLGGSSDHLILDVEDAAVPVNVGDELGFTPTYGALLALSTSPYVQKVVVRG